MLGTTAPPWLTPKTVWRAAAALVLVVLAAFGLLAWGEYRGAVQDARDRGELLARVLEEQASRTVEISAIALAALADVTGGQADAGDPIQLGPTLGQTLLGLPALRSVAVLDLNGRVLASSSMEDVDVVIDLPRLGGIPPRGRASTGGLVPGRHLRDAAIGTAGTTGMRQSFIPLISNFVARNGQNLLLIGLLNPDAFANYQQLAIAQDGDLAWMAGFDGTAMAVGGTDAKVPGDLLRGVHSAWDAILAGDEHGSYVGPGLDGERRIVAFRAARAWPLVIGVEQRLSSVLHGWWDQLRYALAISLVAVLFILGGAWSAARTLRVRLAAREQLELAQLRLEHRERELSVLVKSVQELIFRTDADGIIRFVNARWMSLADERSAEPVGRHLAELVQPSYREPVRALFDPARADGVRNAHAVFDSASGRAFHFDLAVVPLHAEGRLVGFAGSAVDVSERWKAQQLLRRQLAFIESLLEISPLPVSMFDTQGRYLIVNQAWCEFFGRSREETIGQRAGYFMHPDDAAVDAARDRQLLDVGGRLRYETTVLHGDGSRRDVVVTKVAVRQPDGALAGVLSTLMDVSEFRAAERATREARDLAEEASRAKSEFIANVSHELRTPLQSILGFSELGMVRSQGQERLAAMFADVQSAGQRMLALVNDLLDVSKIESTVGTFHVERTDLRGPVRSVLRELDPLLERHGLHIELQLDDSPLMAKVDPLRFAQVIRNVLANAIRFSPPGSTIGLSGTVTATDEVHLCVSDRGPGIPPAELEAIFEAFVQSSATKDGAGGTGLGLAICRKILVAHGGRIHAENLEGGGAAFHVYLPAAGFMETRPLG